MRGAKYSHRKKLVHKNDARVKLYTFTHEESKRTTTMIRMSVENGMIIREEYGNLRTDNQVTGIQERSIRQ